MKKHDYLYIIIYNNLDLRYISAQIDLKNHKIAGLNCSINLSTESNKWKNWFLLCFDKLTETFRIKTGLSTNEFYYKIISGNLSMIDLLSGITRKFQGGKL